jgi:hypothetical protein
MTTQLGPPLTNGNGLNGNGTNAAADPKAAGYQMSELGLTGLNRYSGYVFEEFLPQLQGKRAIQIFREMSDNDPVIGAIIFAIDKLVRQVVWRVDPYSEASKDVEAAQFLDECMHDMAHTWSELISEILSMLPFGFCWNELCYKKRSGLNPGPDTNQQDYDNSNQVLGGGTYGDMPVDPEQDLPTSKYSDGKIGWRKIPIRAQETLFRWQFDANGGIQAFIQQSPPSFTITPIPIQKSLLFRTTTHKNNPEGRSVLRNAYRPWFFKKRIEEIEGIGVERDLAGFPMMYVDPKILDAGASPTDKMIAQKYQTIIKNIRRDQQEGLLLPSLYDDNGNKLYELQLISSGGARQFNTDAIITRYSQQICMVALADFIMLGQTSIGSFALSSDKTDLFAVALGSWLDMVKSPFNDFAVPRLFALNGFDTENLPTLTYGDIESPDLIELSQYITALAAAGVPLFPNNSLVKRLLEIANLPSPSDAELDQQQAAQDAAQQMKLALPGQNSNSNQDGSSGGAASQDNDPSNNTGGAGNKPAPAKPGAGIAGVKAPAKKQVPPAKRIAAKKAPPAKKAPYPPVGGARGARGTR